MNITLNQTAWDQWTAYRSAIKKPIKSVSEEAMKLKLMRMGSLEEQQAIVDQSISNQWQGLFELHKGKGDVSAKKTRTKEEQKDADATFEYCQRQSAKEWDAHIRTHGDIGRLHLLEALLSRYDASGDRDSMALAGSYDWAKNRTAEILRSADPAKVLGDFTCWRLVLRLFNDAGLRRLEQRAQGG